MKESEYYELCSLVNKNLSTSSSRPIIFESEYLINVNNFMFDVESLLNIQDEVQFIYDCYYSLLMRCPEESAINIYSSKIRRKTITKEDFIKKIISSDEYQIKNQLG